MAAVTVFQDVVGFMLKRLITKAGGLRFWSGNRRGIELMPGYEVRRKDPTPEQIRTRKRNLQRGWSDDEEQARRGIEVRDAPYEFPMAKETWLFPENGVPHGM